MKRTPVAGGVIQMLVIILAYALEMLIWGGDTRSRAGGDVPVILVPAVSAAAFAALYFRWRHPALVYWLIWVYTMAGLLLLTGFYPFVGLLVVLHAVAVKCSPTTAVWLLVSSAIPFLVNSFNTASTRPTANATFAVAMFGTLAVFMAMAAASWGAGRLSFRSDEKARREQEALAVSAEEALRAERLRIARELHDIVGHAVTGMILSASRLGIGDPTDIGRTRAAINLIEAMGAEAMTELHRMLLVLRSVDDTQGDVTADGPGLDQLPRLIHTTRDAGVPVTLKEEGTRGVLDRSVDLTAYRVVQEALTNVVKHAGEGATANVRLFFEPGSLTITIRNTMGTGAGSPSLGGHGLVGLAERATIANGEFEAHPVADGFLVVLKVPARGLIEQRAASSGESLR